MSEGGWAGIPAVTAAAAERFGDRPAVADGDTRFTYSELHDEARTFGAALVASGVEPGDRVALWAPNSAEWIVAVLGRQRLDDLLATADVFISNHRLGAARHAAGPVPGLGEHTDEVLAELAGRASDTAGAPLAR